MEIGNMLYKNISEIFENKGVSLEFEFKNDKVIVRVERISDDKAESDVYEGIKSI